MSEVLEDDEQQLKMLQQFDEPVNVGLSDRALLMKELSEGVPLNDFGLPIGIYRPDLLPSSASGVDDSAESEDPLLVDLSVVDEETDEQPSELDELQTYEIYQESYTLGELVPSDVEQDIGEDFLTKGDLGEEPTYKQRLKDLIPKQESRALTLPRADIQAAYVPLIYDEGFPTLPTGGAIWNVLPFEPPQAFKAFNAYLSMSTYSGQGVRMLIGLPEFARSNYGIELSVSDIHEYFYLYYWGVRVKAFDMFQLACKQKLTELHAAQVDDEQYKFAQTMMSKLKDYFDDEEDFWDLLTPKTAIDFLKTVNGMQRVASGLPAGAPVAAKEATQPGASMEVIMRKQAKNMTVQGESNLIEGDTGKIVDDMLSDPDMATMAQELIIRMTKHG